MELYQGYDPRSRYSSNEFFFPTHVYSSDTNENLIVLIWEIDKGFIVIEKLSANNFSKLKEER